jgi:hypothetical protein
MLRQPRFGGHRERAHATRFHHANRIGDVEPRHLDIAVAEVAQDLGAAALEWNVHEVETGAFGEDLGIDLLIAADAGAAVTDLARMLPGIGEKFAEVARREFRRGGEKKDRDVGERRDDLHLALVIELHFFREQDRRQRVGRDVADHERVAVGASARHLLDGDDSGSAGLVLDEYVAAQALPQLLGIKSRHHVGEAPGCIRHDDADWLCGVGLRRCLCCEDGQAQRARHGPPKAPHLLSFPALVKRAPTAGF